MTEKPGGVPRGADRSGDRKGRSVSTADASQGRRRNGWVRFVRWLRYRFVIPVQRSRHPPQYTARGVAVGLFWAMTPTVGIQMMFVLAHWLAVRRFAPRWDFNVIHAMAWTWVTNFATVLPAYYLFYVTGQVILGRWDDLTGYGGFVEHRDASIVEDPTTDYLPGASWFLETFYEGIAILASLGLAMLVGCPPYAVAAAWIGYVWSLKLVIARRRLIARKRHGQEPQDPMQTGRPYPEPGPDGGERRRSG